VQFAGVVSAPFAVPAGGRIRGREPNLRGQGVAGILFPPKIAQKRPAGDYSGRDGAIQRGAGKAHRWPRQPEIRFQG
jgi:hypothetical protein